MAVLVAAGRGGFGLGLFNQGRIDKVIFPVSDDVTPIIRRQWGWRFNVITAATVRRKYYTCLPDSVSEGSAMSSFLCFTIPSPRLSGMACSVADVGTGVVVVAAVRLLASEGSSVFPPSKGSKLPLSAGATMILFVVSRLMFDRDVPRSYVSSQRPEKLSLHCVVNKSTVLI